MEMLKPLEKKNHGCLCCESLELHLPFDTVLYQGFGGWYITKDGQHFFSEESDKEFEEMKTLAYIEEIASKEPDADWRAICDTPFHGETYQRQNGKWVLVEQNEGFA